MRLLHYPTNYVSTTRTDSDWLFSEPFQPLVHSNDGRRSVGVDGHCQSLVHVKLYNCRHFSLKLNEYKIWCQQQRQQQHNTIKQSVPAMATPLQPAAAITVATTPTITATNTTSWFTIEWRDEKKYSHPLNMKLFRKQIWNECMAM